LKNIKVITPRTEYNGSRGIQIGLKHFVGDLKKSSDILIVNHVDIGSPDNAFKMSANLETDSEKLHGYVKIVSPSWFKTRNDVPLNLSSNQANYLTYISSPKVTNREGRILPFVELQSLLSRQSSRAKLKITK